MATTPRAAAPLRIAMISVHGLIRGHDLELGRDPDTGGQTKYVVELARVLGARDDVERVDLFTRRITAPEVDADYGELVEELGPGARIVRVAAGPSDVYIPKESLWDHIDAFVDDMAAFLRADDRLPDLLHSHYADAGHVGARLGAILGVPLVHTGHSLGRVKRRRLLASGMTAAEIDERYAMRRRIEAEEDTLAVAERVITSTHQEVEEQYELYDHYRPDAMHVVPPGTDLSLFHPSRGVEWDTPIAQHVAHFLDDLDKPLILAISRPDPRKNILALVEAFGRSTRLREIANLAVVLGSRDDIATLDEGARDVLVDLLVAIDRHDLYGQVAYPKRHEADDVPSLYRLAAHTRGVFVNCALTEPFGLTLLEAGASGLPIVATADGGPRDILANCGHGQLVDPLDVDALEESLHAVLTDPEQWDAYSAAGVEGVHLHYGWDSHAERYLDVVRPLVGRAEMAARPPTRRAAPSDFDRALVADLDQGMLGAPDALPELLELLRRHHATTAFVVATGRPLDSALKELHRHGLPDPDVLITSAGTAIHSRPQLTADEHWQRVIDHQWTPGVVRRVLAEAEGLALQPAAQQSRFKISYYHDETATPADEIVRMLHREELVVNPIFSFGQFLDVVPVRASKGLAMRYAVHQHGIELERTLVIGSSGADEDMLRGVTLGAVVADRHSEELSHVSENPLLYHADAVGARGILEALEHYDFFGACRAPRSDAARELGA